MVFSQFAGQKTVIVCDELSGMEKRFDQYGLSKKFDVKASCTAAECLAGGMSVLNGMETVFLCGVHSHERNIILKYCVANNICAYVVPRIGDVIMSGAQRMHLFYLPMLRVGRYNPPPEFLLVKRAFDVLASSAAILLTSPLMLGVAAAVKLQDGGKVFYRQTRLTKDGREEQISDTGSVTMQTADGAPHMSIAAAASAGPIPNSAMASPTIQSSAAKPQP